MAPSPGGKKPPPQRRRCSRLDCVAWSALRRGGASGSPGSFEPPAEMISSVKSAASAQFEKQSSNGIITACATATHDD